MSANGLKTSNDNGNYAHKCFVETEFWQNKDAENQWLASQGYSYDDNPGAFSTAEVNRRKALVRGSGESTSYGKVAVDFLHVTKNFSEVLQFELRSDEQSMVLL